MNSKTWQPDCNMGGSQPVRVTGGSPSDKMPRADRLDASQLMDHQEDTPTQTLKVNHRGPSDYLG